MYIPAIYQEKDRHQMAAFMRRFSFGIIIHSRAGLPLATHLPFLVKEEGDKIFLLSHFAKANPHWELLETGTALVVFSEPHAYISPAHYEQAQNVPTWNYVAVHAYGQAAILPEAGQVHSLLEETISNYEAAFLPQYQKLDSLYKEKLAAGIVAFRMEVTELQGKKKLSQNKSEREKQNIMESLEKSPNTNDNLVAEYMRAGT